MRTVSLISDTATPCGVEQFQRRLALCLAAATPGAHATCAIVGQPGEMTVLDRTLASHDAVVLGLPLVAWKRRLAAPLRAMALARRRGKAVVVVVHEWADLDWKRRALYRAYLPLATRLLFSSPVVQRQFEADPLVLLVTRQRGLIPIPPALGPPEQRPNTPVARHVVSLREQGKRVLGTFGGIYPRKQPGALLDVVATLKARGQPAHALFVGDFVRAASIDVQALFEADVRRLGLSDDVTVTGFVADRDAVFAALGACDVLVYRFDEGLTSRRTSVFTALLSGRPVVVNSPRLATEFDHHPPFRAALDQGAMTLVATDADTPAFAEAALNCRAGGIADATALYDRAWSLAALTITSVAQPLESRRAPAQSLS